METMRACEARVPGSIPGGGSEEKAEVRGQTSGWKRGEYGFRRTRLLNVAAVVAVRVRVPPLPCWVRDRAPHVHAGLRGCVMASLV